MTQTEDTAPGTYEPVAVKVIQEVAEFTPVFAAWQTYQFLGQTSEQQAFQILPADLKRRRAFIQVRGTIGSPAQNEGSVTSPAANAAIVTIAIASLAPGWYTVNWTVELDGTVGAADQNNFILKGPGLGGGLNSVNDPLVGRYPQNSVSMFVPAGNATALSVRAVAAGTLNAVYSAQITIVPMLVPGGYVLVGQYGQVQNGQGGRILANDPKWEIRAHSALWMAGDGVTPSNVTVYVERDQKE